MSTHSSTLSKSKFTTFLQCPRRLWLETYRPELVEADESADARMAAGQHAGVVARGLFPGGLLIEGENMAERVAKTQEALRTKPKKPLYEATFTHDDVRVMVDILQPENYGYRLIEVKSATSVKEEYLPDASIQAYVVAGCRLLKLNKVEVAYIDTKFVYQGNQDYRGLFRYKNVSAEVKEWLPHIPAQVEAAMKTLASKHEPKDTPGKQCSTPFACPFLHYCAPVQEEYPVETLPRIGSKAASLRQQGYADIRDIPETFSLTASQHFVWKSVTKGKPILLPGAKTAVSSLRYPRYYMDFETIHFAVPEWPGTRPYEQIPFQWSCHVEKADGILEHHEFLSDLEDGDPRRAFAESLIRCLKKSGPVIVYNAPFEKGVLRALAKALPDLGNALSRIEDKVFDLLPIARDNYYHPDMGGSWSIKSVLPTVALDLDYANLAVSDGGQAQAAFLAMLKLPRSSAEREKIRQDLLAYCERDTLAMVRLARFFCGYATE